MRNSVLFAALTFLILANASPAQNYDDIIVNAPTREAEAIERQARTFIQQISDTEGQEQFSRRDDEFCIRIIGIDPHYHIFFLNKIRDAARETGSQKEGKENCKPNIFVIFTENADDLVEVLKKRRPSIFSSQPKTKRDEIFKSGRPIRWWYGTNIKGSGGEPLLDGTLYKTSSSLISSGVQIDLTSNIIIVDMVKSEGYPLDSISSFVSMISFAQVKGSINTIDSELSILGLFNSNNHRIEPLRNLTVWDRAYLHALYSIPADRPLWQQRSRLRGAMVDYIRKN